MFSTYTANPLSSHHLTKGLSSPTTMYHYTMSLPTIAGSLTTPTVTYAMSPGQTVQGLYDFLTNMGIFLASCHKELLTWDEEASPRFKGMTSLPSMDCTMCRMLELKP